MGKQIIFTEEQKISKIVVFLLVTSFVAGFVLWLFMYPISYGSLIFWVGAILMAIPGYVAGESLGSMGLMSNFSRNLPKVLRIFFGVFWVIVCLLIFGVVLGLLSSMIEA